MNKTGKSNPHLWKLALLAGLIWIIILVRFNNSGSTATSSAEAETVESIAQGISTASPTPVSTSPESARQPTATPVPATPTPTRVATRVPTRVPTLPPLRHTVQAGEAPLLIAAQYDISVDELMEINEISDPASLQIGQELIIPITVTPTPQPSPTSSTPQSSPTATRTPEYYTVQAGDVLLSIAAEYETTVEAIMLANDITDPRTLQIGQELLIPPDKGSPLGVKTIIHEIEGGDTLLGLASRYGSTLEDIEATNPELEPTLLQVGQQIVVPLTQSKIDPSGDPTLPRVTSPVEPSPELVGLEQAMLTALNSERQAQGLAPLAMDDQIRTLARAHAQDMVSRGYFSHVTLEGKTIRDRFEERELAFYWVGENIQRNVQPIDQSAQYAFDWFMGSRPHRNNILHDHFDRIGIGVAEGPPGWYTYVLAFAGDS